MAFIVNRSAIGPGQKIQVFYYGSQWGNVDFTILAKCNSGQTAPLRTGAQAIQQFDERDFPVESHHGVQAGDAAENLRRLEAGVMTPHREMRGYSCVTQLFN